MAILINSAAAQLSARLCAPYSRWTFLAIAVLILLSISTTISANTDTENLAVSNAAANRIAVKTSQTSTVPLYLPINSVQFPSLIDQLRNALAARGIHSIQVQNTDFWHPYQQGLRLGQPGIYFAQPHFAAWTINQHRFVPMLKLHGQLKYVLAVRRSDSQFFELSDLAGKVICREQGLNLGTVWLNQLLGQQRLTARAKEVASVKTTLMESLEQNSRECDAFVLSAFSFERIKQTEQDQLILFAQSPRYKHHAFVAHPQLESSVISELTSALRSKEVREILQPYLSSLSRWQNLLPIKDEDYNPNDARLLMPYWSPAALLE